MTDAATQLNSPVEALFLFELKMSGRDRSAVGGINAQIFTDVLGIDNLSRIHQAQGVKGLLDLLKGSVELVAKKFAILVTAHQPVSVLATPGTAVLADQVKTFLGNGPHDVQVFLLFEIQDGAQVNHPRTGMGIEGQGPVMLSTGVENPSDILTEMFHRHAGIFDKRKRLRVPLHSQQNSQRMFSNTPYRFFRLFGGGVVIGIETFLMFQAGLHCCPVGLNLVLGFPAKLHHQDGLGCALDKLGTKRGHGWVGASQFQAVVIQDLHGGRLVA